MQSDRVLKTLCGCTNLQIYPLYSSTNVDVIETIKFRGISVFLGFYSLVIYFLCF